tara:strand:+ start:499 stop:1923 length:1425 start_codon:yes stop_codon:yes gene_type:complete
MSSPQQILGDQFELTFVRLNITNTDWWAKVGEFQGDAVKMKTWVDEMESKIQVEDVVAAVVEDVVAAVVEDVAAVDEDVVAAAVEDVVAAAVEDVAAVAEVEVENAPIPTPKPKRAITAWTAFFSSQRAEFKAKNPDIASKDIMGALSKIWNTLDEDGKAPFTKKAEEDKIRYNKEMETYVPDPSAPTKKTKKTKKTKISKCSKQCAARVWSSAYDGKKQCGKKCVSDDLDFCKKCQSHADNYGGKTGPELWKHCLDNGISRKDTKKKGTPGLWFGRMDQTEGEFEYPASSFVSEDGKRVVVLAFPKNENHDSVVTWQVSQNAILAHDTTIDEAWPKKWHKLGEKAKKSKATKSKTKVTVESAAVEKIFTEEDDDDDVENLDALPVELDVNTIQCKYEGFTFNVNPDTLDVLDKDDEQIGMWEMPPNIEDPPTDIEELKCWLSKGWPDNFVEEMVVNAEDDDEDDDEDDNEDDE